MFNYGAVAPKKPSLNHALRLLGTNKGKRLKGLSHDVQD